MPSRTSEFVAGKELKPDWRAHTWGLSGGYLADIPLPHRRLFPHGRGYKRRVTVQFSMFYGIGTHWYASLREDDNPIWNAATGRWQLAHDDKVGRGRSLHSKGFTTKHEAEYWVECGRTEFPPATHIFEIGLTERRWFYKEGD